MAAVLCAAGAAIVLRSAGASSLDATEGAAWTQSERAILHSLSLASLPPLPADPSNRYAGDAAAAALGRAWFFEPKLSGNGQVSCATCHDPSNGFQDSRPLGLGVGTAGRRTMPIAGTAYSPWQFWDGRSDSQWSQALGPLESAVEHGGDRVRYAHVIDADYRREYASVFGPLPNLHGLPAHAGPVADTARRQAWLRIPSPRQQEVSRVYANIGKAIAAYERNIRFTATRFDRFVDAELSGRPHTPDDRLSDGERAGLRLFIGKANCATCHNGALLTDDHFHNTGVPMTSDAQVADSGRTVGVRQVMASEFGCLSPYSDASPDDCAELRFAVTDGAELLRAYKTPSLRNAATRAPYMHAGQFRTLQEVLAHYNRAPLAPAGTSELKRLALTDMELRQIEAFLHTLVAPLEAPVVPYPR
ncbi:MAG: cytochrome c peroxidase [Gemmatimonadota bacterium]